MKPEDKEYAVTIMPYGYVGDGGHVVTHVHAFSRDDAESKVKVNYPSAMIIDVYCAVDADDANNKTCNQCGFAVDGSLYECPYTEIDGRYELCNCCDGCQQSCAADV